MNDLRSRLFLCLSGTALFVAALCWLAAMLFPPGWMLNVGTVAAVILGLSAAWLFARHTLRPAEQLAEEFERLLKPESVRSSTTPLIPEFRRIHRGLKLLINEQHQTRDQLENLVAERTDELKRAKDRLERVHSTLSATFQASPDGIALEQDGIILLANEPFFKLTGQQPPTPGVAPSAKKLLVQTAGSDLGARGRRLAVWERTRTAPEETLSDVWRLRDRMLMVYTSPVGRGNTVRGRIWMLRDCTEIEKLQVGLRKAQKLEFMGRLAGGVAHEFNNILTSVLGNIQLLQSHPVQTDGQRATLASARQAAEKGSRLVRQLSGCSSRLAMDIRWGRVDHAVLDAASLLDGALGKGVRLTVQIDPGTPSVPHDAAQLSQVLLNLCLNASEAIQRTGRGGQIHLSTCVETLPDSPDKLSPDHAVLISVEDDGPGVPTEVRHRLFEPFFTTKPQGAAPGLGLAMASGIIQQHGGWIECQSEPGRGATFQIYLPVPRRGAVERPVVKAPSDNQLKPQTTVMVVDDDDSVRAVTSKFLSCGGFRVIEANGGEAAMEQFRVHRDGISAIVLDYFMPEKLGTEVYADLLSEGCHAPVIVCSGNISDLTGFTTADGHTPERFLPKPTPFDQLVTAVREVVLPTG